MDIANNWKDYELIDAGSFEKLERWNNIYLLRPDPQVIWDDRNLLELYKNKIDAYYKRSNTGGGFWQDFKKINESWIINYKDLKFNIKKMGFKHTGLFPEQAVNWDFMRKKIKSSKRKIKVLNLFAYTGGATIACLKENAHVTHVDSSRGMIDWCKGNVKINNIDETLVRYIEDDVLKFVKREMRRGNKYDAIIMDPPSYGRGSNKEVWSFEKNIYELVNLTFKLLSDNPLFFIINSYTTGISSKSLENILKNKFNKGIITSGELGLNITKNNLVLPCGIYGRWENE